jgi:hypothetical protein
VVLPTLFHLDGRSATRLALLFQGAILARGRRTVASSIRAAKLSDRFRPGSTIVPAAGKKVDRIAVRPGGRRSSRWAPTTSGLHSPWTSLPPSGNGRRCKGRRRLLPAGRTVRLQKGGRVWAKAALRDRIDAIIAHEWVEDQLDDHNLALKAAPKTELPVTDEARRILKAMGRSVTGRSTGE